VLNRKDEGEIERGKGEKGGKNQVSINNNNNNN
jgi:hypothetical protein